MEKVFKVFLTALVIVSVAVSALAAGLDSPAPPTDPGSAMYTGEDLYNRLTTGAAGAKRVGPFAEPATGPGASGHNLDEIMAVMPTGDNVNGATANDVLSGRTFWGLRTDGTWGLKTGTRPSLRPVPLNPTGITTWGNGTTNSLLTAQAAYPRQDADTAQSVFSFTKLDAANGATLADSAPSWGCVRDNTTGLIWEVKTADGGLHDFNWTYTWYNSNASTNGGSAGTGAGGSCGGSVAAGCDTEKFVAAVNAAGWCGYNDWRMPMKGELKSIVDFSTSSPAIKTSWFPNTVSLNYWSNSAYAANLSKAWPVPFFNGHGAFADKTSSFNVRLVRGGL